VSAGLLRLVKVVTPDLVGLQAAGHAVLVHAAAAVGQAAPTQVAPAARRVDVAAAVHQQVAALTHVAWRGRGTLGEGGGGAWRWRGAAHPARP